METRTRTQNNTMTLNCLLCAMTYTNISRNKSNRPLKLCQKILKNCIEYMDENDLGDAFMKFECKRQPLPLCSRCFVTTEKLSQLNDKLEEIRAEILDLVESFKLEFLKSREVMSIYNSKSTSKATKKKKCNNISEAVVKEEIILEDATDGSEPSEPFENDNFTNESVENDSYVNIQRTDSFTDLLTLDVQENVDHASNKRGLSDDDEASDSDLLSEKNFADKDSGKKWDSSDSSDDSASFSNPQKKKAVKRKKKKPKTEISNDLYMKTDFALKPEMSEYFTYKGHVVGAELLVLTCKLCQQDKRGGRGADLCNFRRHLRIKHDNNSEKICAPVKKKVSVTPRKIMNGEEILEERQINLQPSVLNHFKYKGHIPNTKNYVLTCNICGRDRRGQDPHNFLRHLKKMHSRECGFTTPVQKAE